MEVKSENEHRNERRCDNLFEALKSKLISSILRNLSLFEWIKCQNFDKQKFQNVYTNTKRTHIRTRTHTATRMCPFTSINKLKLIKKKSGCEQQHHQQKINVQRHRKITYQFQFRIWFSFDMKPEKFVFDHDETKFYFSNENFGNELFG